MNFQTKSDYPNWDLDKFQIPIFPRPFGWISRPTPITQIEIWASFKSQFSSTCLDSGFPNRWITQIEIWTSFKSQFPRPGWTKDFQIGSDSPNGNLKKSQIPISPRPFEKFSNWVRFVYSPGFIGTLSLIKAFPKFVQIPNLAYTFQNFYPTKSTHVVTCIKKKKCVNKKCIALCQKIFILYLSFS